MAGGAGTRFWPASTEAHPKQFLDILGLGKTLLQMTYERFLPLVPKERIYVVTNRKYEDLVARQLPKLPEDNILGEPSRNNTAPCMAYATYKILDIDPEANIVVASSDHLILKESDFLDRIRIALSFTADHDAICCLGIHPSRPDTGYGYIHFGKDVGSGIHKVVEFKEKPDLETAKEYLDEGNYIWNSGIFIFSGTSMVKALREYAPLICDLLAEVPYNSSEEYQLLEERYPLTPNISIDYAVMESAENIYTLPADIGWSDLGTWGSLHAELQKDEQGNAVQSGKSIIQDANGNLIRVQPGKTVVIRGMNNMIVVDETDALLIFPMDQEQEIKGVVKGL
ncbi:MAG: mannose-1-phosphate guanylyltransferase [Saprospiraceae bacterium]|nr:mannose-1-phosphate guanylyltransferase [Saprospiraceae bacterium]